VQSVVLRSHVVCLSVCLSVTLVNCDHIGWNSSKIISSLVSLGCSLSATPTWRVCSKGNSLKFGPKVTHPPIDLSVGNIRSQIAVEWLQIAQRSQWRAYRKPPSLLLMVSSLTPLRPPLPPKWGYHMPQYTRMAISLQRVIRSTSCLVLGWGFRDGGSNGAMYGSNKSKMAAAAILEKFQMAISPHVQLTIYLYSAHRAVIFAIAQLSCCTHCHCTDRAFRPTILLQH